MNILRTPARTSYRPGLSVALAACIAAIVSVGSIANSAEPTQQQATGARFELLPETRIKLSVVEWISTLGEYKEWPALGGEFGVSADGFVSIPLVGNIDTAGKTPSEVAAVISQSIQDHTGLTTAPVVSLQIAAYPPVYVTGSVQQPGAVDFRPGLTVMQAVALAGGRERRTNTADRYSALDQIRYTGELGRTDLQIAQQMARRARLQAELSNAGEISFSDEFLALADQPSVAQIMKTETVLFDARKQALQRQISSLEDLTTLLEKEIEVLGEKMVAQDRQIAIAEQELKGIAKLVGNGTVTKSRETGLERVVADLQSGKLDMTVALMRARQKVSETSRDAIGLQTLRETEVSRDLQVAETELEDLRMRRATTRQLLRATGAIIAENVDLGRIDLEALEYSVVRRTDPGISVDIDDSGPLMPGDLLQVRFQFDTRTDPLSLSSITSGVQANVR